MAGSTWFDCCCQCEVHCGEAFKSLRHKKSSCPALSRAFTSLQPNNKENVDGRDKPGHDGFNLYSITAERYDTPHRNHDRTDRHPDVVAIGRADGGDGQDSSFSTGGDDIRDWCAGRVSHLDRTAGGDRRIAARAAGMDRRGRWAVRLSCALFSRAAIRAPRRSRSFELSLAVVDRTVFVVPAWRAA